jgi:prepilin-type N-terminal cleavage/methylation domain-containing protein
MLLRERLAGGQNLSVILSHLFVYEPLIAIGVNWINSLPKLIFSVEATGERASFGETPLSRFQPLKRFHRSVFSFMIHVALRKKNLNAFTITELLVVIAIIAILAGILVPVVNGVRARGKFAKSQSNIRQLGSTLLIYTTDNSGRLPWSHGAGAGSSNWILDLRAAGYERIVGGSSTEKSEVMQCPLAVACRPVNADLPQKSYAMNQHVSKRLLSNLTTPSLTALLMNSRWNPGSTSWAQTDVGAANGTPNVLPDFPWPIRTLSASDAPDAGAPDPQTMVVYIDGHVESIARSAFVVPTVASVKEPFWGKE